MPVITEKRLAEMFKESLKASSPRTYRELREAGKLEEVAALRAEAVYEAMLYATERALDEAATSSLQTDDRVRRHMQANRVAAEVAVAQATQPYGE
jgi:hypothetical protein